MAERVLLGNSKSRKRDGRSERLSRQESSMKIKPKEPVSLIIDH